MSAGQLSTYWGLAWVHTQVYHLYPIDFQKRVSVAMLPSPVSLPQFPGQLLAAVAASASCTMNCFWQHSWGQAALSQLKSRWGFRAQFSGDLHGSSNDSSLKSVLLGLPNSFCSFYWLISPGLQLCEPSTLSCWAEGAERGPAKVSQSGYGNSGF